MDDFKQYLKFLGYIWGLAGFTIAFCSLFNANELESWSSLDLWYTLIFFGGGGFIFIKTSHIIYPDEIWGLKQNIDNNFINCANPSIEKEILKNADSKGRVLTAVELASCSNYTVIECEEALKALVEMDLAVNKTAKEGLVIYTIKGFLSDKEKEAAREL